MSCDAIVLAVIGVAVGAFQWWKLQEIRAELYSADRRLDELTAYLPAITDNLREINGVVLHVPLTVGVETVK